MVARERELVDSRPETMILRVDRTDPSKNVVRGLEAFGLLLERRPDLRGRVGMVALLDPSRQEIPEYVEELHRIEAAAAALEERFPGALQLQVGDDFPPSVAAYKQFDVLLVNAIMDGLNLVAKEAPLVNTQDGVVVLSVNTGAYEELGEWIIPVDPLDVEGQATALEESVGLPRDERRTRLEAIREQVRTHDLEAWIDALLADLDRASTMRQLCDATSRGHVPTRVARTPFACDRRMVDVGGKPMSRRRAVAHASVRMAAETAQRLGSLPKGDALATAQLAGIMAAKRTSDLIPLCHPLPLSLVEVSLEVVAGGVEITAAAETTAQTGVEMEALVAASVAALTVYDMAKAIDKEMVIAEVTLVEKTKEEV